MALAAAVLAALAETVSPEVPVAMLEVAVAVVLVAAVALQVPLDQAIMERPEERDLQDLVAAASEPTEPLGVAAVAAHERFRMVAPEVLEIIFQQVPLMELVVAEAVAAGNALGDPVAFMAAVEVAPVANTAPEPMVGKGLSSSPTKQNNLFY
ncbi:hypothetical protein D3C87_1750190 [compost metagenome]